MLITKELVKKMKKGSVLVDVCIDQGGCCETSKPTTHSDPVYVVDEVVHYCVTNMPGAVGRTSSHALCNATLNWILRLAEIGIDGAIAQGGPLRESINVHCGKITNSAVAEAFDLPFESI